MIFNTNNPIPSSFYPNNFLNSIQHQHYFTRQQKSSSMKTLNLLFTELHPAVKSNIHHHRIEHDFERQPTILIRRQRAILESLLPSQQPSDIHEVFGNHLEVNLPPRSLSRTKLSRNIPFRDKSKNDSKAIKHNIKNKKSSHSLQIPIWTPLLPEKGDMHTKVSSSKIHPSKNTYDKQVKRQQLALDSKFHFIPELSTPPTPTSDDLETFKVSTIKDLFDEWETHESNITTQSDGDESLIVHCNSPSLIASPKFDESKSIYFTYSTSETDHQVLPLISLNANSGFKRSKTMSSRQHSYNNLLPPVFEDVNNEETFDDFS